MRWLEIVTYEKRGLMGKYQCVVTVVSRGKGHDVVDASRRKGAKGGTILKGKGTSLFELKKLFSGAFEAEKEIVITLIEAEKAQTVMDEIRQALEIDEPGHGVIFVLNVESVEGLLKTASL